MLWRLTQPSSGLFGRGLESTPLRWVGGISYEMYLWHWPTYLVLTSARTHLEGLNLFAVRLTAVVALSWLTHVLVDEPIRRGVRLRSPRLARSAIVMVVIAVSVGTFAATVGAEPALSGDVGQLVDRGGPPTVPVRHEHRAAVGRRAPRRPRRRNPSSCSWWAIRRRRRWRRA